MGGFQDKKNLKIHRVLFIRKRIISKIYFEKGTIREKVLNDQTPEFEEDTK